MEENAEMINRLLDIYVSLQRLKSAENYEEELDYQIKLVKIKLEYLGIDASKFDRKI